MNYGKKSTAKKRTALISRSSMMGKRARVSFIRVAPSVIWISQETWIPALPSDWSTKRMEKSVSAPEPESWQTVFRKKNSRNAATRQEPWYRQLNRHRRD